MLTATAAQYFAMPKMRRAKRVAPVCTGIEIDQYLNWVWWQIIDISVIFGL